MIFILFFCLLFVFSQIFHNEKIFLVKSEKGLPWWLNSHLTVQGMWVRSLGWEDPLENKMATYSSILACEIPRTEELGMLQFMGVTKVLNMT